LVRPGISGRALYGYLAGVEFKQKIEGIIEAFTSMQDQLNKERRAMEKHWKQREKQIERVVPDGSEAEPLADND
jgi:hypothetical protein